MIQAFEYYTSTNSFSYVSARLQLLDRPYHQTNSVWKMVN